jgi:tetratricopeptide (TPR) repeat protein
MSPPALHPRLDLLWSAAQAAPLDPAPWRHLLEGCLAVSDEGGVDEAMDHLEAMDLGDAAFWRPVAQAMEQAGAWPHAYRAWRRVVSETPDDPEPYRRLAGALSQGGELGLALVTLEAAMRLAPDDAETHRWLARGLLAKGQLSRARHHARRAQQLEPEHPSMQVLLQTLGPLGEDGPPPAPTD